MYRVYTFRGNNYVKLGGIAWMVYGNFNKTKSGARSRLEHLKWSLRGTARGKVAPARCVKTNFGWAVVTTSPLKQYQPSSKILKTPR